MYNQNMELTGERLGLVAQPEVTGQHVMLPDDSTLLSHGEELH